MLPVDALAFNYRIVMYHPPDIADQGFSQIGVVASEDTTQLSVTFPRDANIEVTFSGTVYSSAGNNVIRVTLELNQALVIIERNGADLSG